LHTSIQQPQIPLVRVGGLCIISGDFNRCAIPHHSNIA
jgi:hypothetical protein